MSRRQNERASRFQTDVEQAVRAAAATFRDNDVERSTAVVIRLWWTSRLRGRRFVELVAQARGLTAARISVGGVQHGAPGQRQAMPYFLAVLRDLTNQERRPRRPSAPQRDSTGARGVPPPSPATPFPSALTGTRFSDSG
jgi:hypothetical protein